MTRYRRHSCTYPIEKGNIIGILDPWNRFNENLGYSLDHTLYIWILRHGRWIEEEGRPGKHRIMHAAFLYIPNIREGISYHLIFKRKMLKTKLTQFYLNHRNYELIAQNVHFNYSNKSWARFYRQVGLL